MITAIARCNIEVTHRSGNQQTIPVYWQRISGATNSQRPMLICNCGHRAFKLYSLQGMFRCKHCAIASGARYACQMQSAKRRPALQVARLRRFLGGLPDSVRTPARPALMHKQTYARLIGRLQQLETQITANKHYTIKLDDRVIKPVSLYRTQVANIANA
jgi:hypothetical protein